MSIHPYLIEEHIRQREQQQAARRRAGWALVEIGLVLVEGCGDD